MKKIYTVITLLILSFSANAQIKQNTWLLGSQLSFGQNKNSNETAVKSKSGSIRVLSGKAVKENIIVGINFGFSSWKQTGNYTGYAGYSNEEIIFNYGAFSRVYKPLVKDLYFFTQLDLIYIAGRGKRYDPNIEPENSTTRGGALSVTPGLSYRIYKKLQFEITLPNLLNVQYTAKKIRSTDPSINTSKEEGFQANTSFSNNSGNIGYLGAGFHWLL